MGSGITFDTGALIALEAKRLRMRKRLQLATMQRRVITVPAVVVAEWWRGRTDLRDKILAGVRIEPLNDLTARVAGAALAALGGNNTIDAIVMASAAQRGDVVYTSDIEDLQRLNRFFPSVCVLAA